MSLTNQSSPSDFDDTMPTYRILGDMLVRKGTFKFRVVKLSSGGFGVFADMFPVENYSSEEEAMALCNRLIHQQAREIQKTILKSTGTSPAQSRR